MVYCLDLLHLQRCQTYYGDWGGGYKTGGEEGWDACENVLKGAQQVLG